MKKLLATVLTGMVLWAPTAQAKWWIFGRSAGPVVLDYLTLNQVPLDDTGGQVTLYKELLPDGVARITGRARARQGKIASVNISLDDRKSWKPAKVESRGAFEYTFTPEKKITYVVYVEAMDTTGKTNEVDATRREVVLSEDPIQKRVMDVLNAMAEAYMQENLSGVMSHVDEEFAGDVVILDRAVRNDFSKLENIDLRFTLNNVAGGSGGKVFAVITFNRAVTFASGGQRQKDRGVTEFAFVPRSQGLKVYSMKRPLIFGVSDPDVATGTTVSTENENTLTLGTVVTESVNLTSRANNDYDGLVLATNDITSESDPTFPNPTLAGDIALLPIFDPPSLVTRSGMGLFKDLGPGTLDNITQVPASGYNAFDNHLAPPDVGNVYALKLANGRYAAIEIISLTGVQPNFTLGIRYKYQPDGTPNF